MPDHRYTPTNVLPCFFAYSYRSCFWVNANLLILLQNVFPFFLSIAFAPGVAALLPYWFLHRVPVLFLRVTVLPYKTKLLPVRHLVLAGQSPGSPLPVLIFV